MAATQTPTGTRSETVSRVTSKDGTEIAYFSSGDGPPLVLVHGTTASHIRWAPLLGFLEPHVTVHAVDRRGRGASGDGPEYAIEREYEDIAAVVDRVAEEAEEPVAVLGHSYGGVVSYGAASLTSNIRSLLLYEGWPATDPSGMEIPAALRRRMDDLIARGEPEAALEVFMLEGVEMRADEFAVYRTLPAWPARVAAAPTIARESAATPAFDPEVAARMRMPVLLLVGGDSPDMVTNGYEAVAAALPDATVVILEGQQHIAIDIVPEEFARHVLDFIGAR